MHYRLIIDSVEGSEKEIYLKSCDLHKLFTVDQCKSGRVSTQSGDILVTLEEVDEECTDEECVDDLIKYVDNKSAKFKIICPKPEE